MELGRRHWSNWRIDAREAFDFYAGVQWDELDRAKLDDEGRPCVTFNRIPRTINAIMGIEVQNRQEVRYLPRVIDSPNEQNPELNDSGYADAMTNAAKWARDQCDAEDEESDAFQDGLICGCGFTETRLDYEENPDGDIKEDRIDPLEMMVDPYSKKKNFADARWIARIKDLDIDEFDRLFPGKRGQISFNTFWNDYEATPHDADNAQFYRNDQSDKLSRPRAIWVAQYQYFVTKDYYRAQDEQTGQVIDFEAKRFTKIEPLIEASGIKFVKVKKRVYKQAFITGRTLLKHHDLDSNNFTFKGITGLRDRNRNRWFGLVQLMKDPQRWANKWLSQFQHIINTNAKGGLYVEDGALSNPRKAEEDFARSDAIINLTDGAISGGKIQERSMPKLPEGVDRLLQYAIAAINDIPGVNLEVLGQVNRDQGLGIELSRKAAGITIMAVFFDSLRRFRKMQARVLAYFIKEYIADGRLIRILGQNGAKYVPLIKDALAFQYDIIVDDAPTSMNVKERTFGILTNVLPMALQAGIPVPPEFLDYTPLPDSLVQSWKKLIADSSDDSKQQELDMINNLLLQLDVEQREADIEKTQSETEKNMAQAEHQRSLGHLETMRAREGGLAAESSMKQRMMLSDQQRKNLEMILNQRRKNLEVALDYRLKAAKNTRLPSLTQIQ